MKKKTIIALITTFSIIVSISQKQSIINNPDFILQVLYTLLGLCLTAYIFICPSISSTIKGNQKIHKSAIKLLSELEGNMKTIFFFSLIIIITIAIKNIDVPFIVEPKNIDFGLFRIISLKGFFVDCIISNTFLLSLYTFYDLMNASFLIIKGTLFNLK